MTLETAIEKLNELEKASYALGHAMSILYTDGDTVAPKNSWKGRGMALGYLSELIYKQMVNPETGEVLETILQHRDEVDEVTFRRAEVMKESYDDLHVLPMEEYALRAVHGGCFRDNIASARAMEKAGMVLCGHEDNSDPRYLWKS